MSQPINMQSIQSELLSRGVTRETMEVPRTVRNEPRNEPIVPPPALADFELRLPNVFPALGTLPDPRLTPPAGIDSLLDIVPPPILPIEQTGNAVGTPDASVTVSRAVLEMEMSAMLADAAGVSMTRPGRIELSSDAAETAAIARDQIRWDPRQAIASQANSVASYVLSLLK